jgi:hypothetical protein
VPLWPPWRCKPPIGTPLDRSHPLYQGLVVCFPFWEVAAPTTGSQGYYEAVSQQIIAANRTDSAVISSPYGLAMQSNSGASSAPLLVSGLSLSNANCTLGAAARPYTVAAWYALISSVSGGSTNEYELRTDTGGHPQLDWGYSKTGYMQPTASSALATGQWAVLAGTGVLNAAKLFQDGKMVGSATSAGMTQENITQLAFGSRTNGDTGAGNALGLVCIWNRALSDAEALSFTANPWQIFLGQGWIFNHAASGTAYNLAALAGAFTGTGLASHLTASRSLVAAAGAYTGTGLASKLWRSRSLVTAAGAFTGTGATAGLGATRHLVTAAGAYTGTGISSGLKSARTLTTLAGSYTGTGVAAGLTWTHAGTYTLTGLPGSFAGTGVAAGLKSLRHLVALAGAFTGTGATAGLGASRHLVAAAGAFTGTGTTASLGAGRHLVTAAGAYTGTGISSGLKSARSLVAAAGSYTGTGVAAGLTKSHLGTYILTALPGSFAQTGIAAGLKSARHLVTLIGAFAETGSTAGLGRGLTLTAAAGAYTGAGLAARLGSTRSMITAPGSFSQTGAVAGLTYWTSGYNPPRWIFSSVIFATPTVIHGELD